MSGWYRTDHYLPAINSGRHRWVKRYPRSAGLSLLEVVLALAILSVAAAYLSQSMYLAVENAIRSQANTEAELIAESVMNQVVAGFLPAQPVTWSSYGSPNPFGNSRLTSGGTQWLYSIQNMPTEVQGMIGIQVSVVQVRPGREINEQTDLTIIRWIIDPNLGLDTPQNTTLPASSAGAAVGGVL
jgi:prepilin-type N-terminal cleavage/methylation domain-containing protein